MDDIEKLKRENLQLRTQLAQAEARICQFVYDQAMAELKAMDAQKPEPPPMRVVGEAG